MKNVHVIFVVLVAIVISAGFSPLADAASFKELTGPIQVQAGAPYTYFIGVDGAFTDAGWNITGGKILSQWWEGTQFFCQVQWSESSPDKPATIEVWGKEKNGRVKVERLTVALLALPTPTPTVAPVQTGAFSDLNGPTIIQPGSTYTYSVIVNGAFTEVGWNAVWGKVIQQWWEGSQFFCQVQWVENTPEHPATIEVWGKTKKGKISAERLAIAAPPTPTPAVSSVPGKFNTLNGPTTIKFGEIYTYSVAADGEFNEIVWEVTGGKLLRQWQDGSQYFCQVRWEQNTPEKPAKIKVFGKQKTGQINAERLSVSSQPGMMPDVPGEPGNLKNLTGPKVIQLGQTYTYSVTLEGVFAESGWSVTGGKVIQQWQQGNQLFCQVQWTENRPADPAKIKVWGTTKAGETKSERLFVISQTTSAPSPVASPSKLILGYGMLRNGSNKCLDVSLPDLRKNGGKVQTWQCNGQTQQLWMFDKQSRLVNKGGKCLAVAPDDLMKDGGTVYVWECNDQINQQWQIDSQGGLVNAGGSCLELHADDMAINGGRVRILHCHYDTNQQWQLEPLQK